MGSRELACRGVHRSSVLSEDDHQSTAMQKEEFDGAIWHDGLVWGTYIHGVFDEPGLRRTWLNRARERKDFYLSIVIPRSRLPLVRRVSSIGGLIIYPATPICLVFSDDIAFPAFVIFILNTDSGLRINVHHTQRGC